MQTYVGQGTPLEGCTSYASITVHNSPFFVEFGGCRGSIERGSIERGVGNRKRSCCKYMILNTVTPRCQPTKPTTPTYHLILFHSVPTLPNITYS
jgi:hypothetical protein